MLSILTNLTLSAQTISPAKAQYMVSKTILKKGDEATLTFTITIPDNWLIYSNIQNYELGPFPTSFLFEPNTGYKLLGPVIPIGSRQKYDPIFQVQVNYFDKAGQFQQKIKLRSDNTVVKGYYDYQLCSTTENKCLMVTENFEFNIQTTP